MPKNSRVSSSLEPVKHLSVRLQRKLVKRASRQRKRFRSSDKPYPLVMDMPGTESVPTAVPSLTTGQRVALVIASLVMLLMLGLVGLAAAMHTGNGILFLILAVIAVFTFAAVIINILMNRKP